MNQEDSNQRERKAMAISVGLHVALALLFVFILAWREPDLPIPEFGIELNFGLDAVGSGDIQRTTPPVPAETEVEESNEEETVENEPEEALQELIESEPEVQEELQSEVEEPGEEQPISEVESPDVVEEIVVEEQPSEESEPEPVVEEVVPEVNEVSEVENATEVSEPATPGENELPTETTDGNQGDRKDEAGDQGDPAGELDARALYRSPGSTQGASLDLTGWNWDYLPKPNDTSNESGRIVFEITIDDAGYIIGIKTIEKTVTPAVEKIYRDEVQQLTFSPTTRSSRPAPTSTGRITFIIRTN